MGASNLRCSKHGANQMILFVRDDLAKGGDPFFDSLDFFRPGASRVVGIGDTGGVFALGFGEIFE
jgi:hypothetical protein